MFRPFTARAIGALARDRRREHCVHTYKRLSTTTSSGLLRLARCCFHLFTSARGRGRGVAALLWFEEVHSCGQSLQPPACALSWARRAVGLKVERELIDGIEFPTVALS